MDEPENTLSVVVEEDLNNICKRVEKEGQVFAGLAIYGLTTDEPDVLDKATVSLSYSTKLPRETQRAMLRIAHRLIGSMIDD